MTSRFEAEFRSRLIAGNAQYLLFDTLLDHFKQRGLLKAGGRQRTDATHVLAKVRALNRVLCVGETFRATLNSLAIIAPGWLHSFVPEEWHARYDHRVEEHALPRESTKRTEVAELIGADGYQLLAAIDGTPALNWLHHVPAVQLLRRVWLQQFELVEGQVHFRSNDNIPPPATMICSPSDTEATYGRKSTEWWIGDIRASDRKL